MILDVGILVVRLLIRTTGIARCQLSCEHGLDQTERLRKSLLGLSPITTAQLAVK